MNLTRRDLLKAMAISVGLGGLEALAQETPTETPWPTVTPTRTYTPTPTEAPTSVPTTPTPVPTATEFMLLYVDPVNGNDNNDGSELNPFHTIDKATLVAGIEAIDTKVMLNPGVYRENVRIPTTMNNFWLESLGGPAVTTIRALIGGQGAVIESGNSGNVVIRGITVYDGLEGMYIGDSSTLVQECVIVGNLSRGARVFNGGNKASTFDKVTFDGRSVYRPTQTGVIMEGGNTKGVIYNCIFVNFNIDNNSRAVISDGPTTLDFCNFWQNYENTYGGVVVGSNIVEADPLVMQMGYDYRLQVLEGYVADYVSSTKQKRAVARVGHRRSLGSMLDNASPCFRAGSNGCDIGAFQYIERPQTGLHIPLGLSIGGVVLAYLLRELRNGER